MHKGLAVQDLVDDLDARGFLFAGDDLGDLEAFEAVERLAAERGLAPLLVCSASAEENPLLARADVVVQGPGGVLDLLRQLTADARSVPA
jgi:trehalose 6-phosphate phosphatase